MISFLAGSHPNGVIFWLIRATWSTPSSCHIATSSGSDCGHEQMQFTERRGWARTLGM